jgi:hypothetical protein
MAGVLRVRFLATGLQVSVIQELMHVIKVHCLLISSLYAAAVMRI